MAEYISAQQKLVVARDNYLKIFNSPLSVLTNLGINQESITKNIPLDVEVGGEGKPTNVTIRLPAIVVAKKKLCLNF